MVIDRLSSNHCDWLVLTVVFMGGIGRKGNRSHSSDSASVELTTALTTPISFRLSRSCRRSSWIKTNRQSKSSFQPLSALCPCKIIIELCRFQHVMTPCGNTAGVRKFFELFLLDRNGSETPDFGLSFRRLGDN